MTAIAKKLDERLRSWGPEKAAEVELMVEEIISLADGDCLDLLRSRATDQEVLGILDESRGR